jgi:hypothetical protein
MGVFDSNIKDALSINSKHTTAALPRLFKKKEGMFVRM